MNYHPNSAPLKRYVASIIEELIGPLEAYLKTEWKPGYSEISNSFYFAWDFQCLAVGLSSNSNGNFSKSAMALCTDIYNLLCGTI